MISGRLKATKNLDNVVVVFMLDYGLWGMGVQVNGELFPGVWKREQTECCVIGKGTLGLL